MSVAMGLYRILISLYYSKKSFASISFVLGFLFLVYFYLPQLIGPTPGSYYLNPRVNKMTVKPFMFRSEDAELGRLKLINIPDYLTELDKCPACFGKDLCPDINSGAIQIVEPDANDELKLKGVYNGYWNSKPVVIKRLNRREEYDKVDAFLCRNATMELNCDVSKAILSDKSLVQSENIFSPDFLRNMWKIIHKRSDQLAVAACLSEDAIKMMSEDFDLDSDNHLSAEEKAFFFTSLVLNPESLFLEFATKEGLQIHFPEVLGHCGRIVVTEQAGQPLSSYLKEDFKKRADIGMMLLGMIFFLQNFSSKWSLVFSDFNFDNFYVKENNIYIVDAEDMLLIDTALYPEPKGQSSTLCNEDCFKHFSLRLFDYDRVPRKNVCPDTPRVTEQAMYALACERILSYLPEHHKYSPYVGLLHDPPPDIANILETSLKECVYETQKDGRIEAVDIISGLLDRYADIGMYDYNDDYEKEANMAANSQNKNPDSNILEQSPNQVLLDQVPNQETGNKISNQETGNQIPNQGTGYQIPNQGTGYQMPNQGNGNQIPNQETGNQIPKQGTGYQIPNQGTGYQMPNQGNGNQIPNQETGNQIPNQGTGYQIPNQGTGYQMQNQGIGNQIPNQGTGNQIPNPGTGNQIPNQGTGNQIPNQGTGNQIPNQGTGNQIPNQGTGNLIPNQETGNQMPYQETGNLIPNQGTGNQMPNQETGNLIPNQETGNQMPNQETGNLIPNQGTGNQMPNQVTGNQIPNPGTGNQIANQGNNNQILNQGIVNDIPYQAVVNDLSNQGMINFVPKQNMANQISSQRIENPIPNQGHANEVPKLELINQIPNQGVPDQKQNLGIAYQIPNQRTGNQMPNQVVENELPKQGMLPNLGMANQIPNQRVAYQIPNQGVAYQVPNQGVAYQVPNQGVANQLPNQRVAYQVPNQ